jgi:hypothetical protein
LKGLCPLMSGNGSAFAVHFSTKTQVFIKEAESVFWFSLLCLWIGQKESKK